MSASTGGRPGNLHFVRIVCFLNFATKPFFAPFNDFSVYVTYLHLVLLEAFDRSNHLIGSVNSAFSSNLALSDGMWLQPSASAKGLQEHRGRRVINVDAYPKVIAELMETG